MTNSVPGHQDIRKKLLQATLVLSDAGIAEPRREARSLMSLALGKSHTFLIAHPEYELTAEEHSRFNAYLVRRAAREPFQYIAGRQEFYGLDFIVTSDVLIPRPETEMIVETAIELFKDKDNIFFCEIGVGSGCISISILHELQTARAIGFDISQKALDVAEKNAYHNSVARRFEFGISDVFSDVDHALQFDLIVSNPPYIPARDMPGLQAEVRDHEPFTALTDGADGLSIVQKILEQAPPFLKPGGSLLMEIGIDQAISVGNMIEHDIWQTFEILPDLQGIPRMVRLQKK
jgi:release factor glutamine methyltransferase